MPKSILPTHSPAFGLGVSTERPVNRDHGVLLVSLTQDVLYLNPTAKRLIGDIASCSSAEGGEQDTGQRLPRKITDLCRILAAQLAQSAQHNDWEHVHLQQAITTPNQRILLRGYGLPDDTSASNRRLLFLLEVIPPGAAPVSLSSDTSLQLSGQQQAIVNGLMRGLSNKQLAEELHLSEHTVKEYLRAIMLKTQTTTRAGVIARLLGRHDRPSTEQKRSERPALAARTHA